MHHSLHPSSFKSLTIIFYDSETARPSVAPLLISLQKREMLGARCAAMMVNLASPSAHSLALSLSICPHPPSALLLPSFHVLRNAKQQTARLYSPSTVFLKIQNTLFLPMPKKYYAVAVGRQVGIFDTWPQCESKVKGFPGAKFQSFKSRQEAENYVSIERNDYNEQTIEGFFGVTAAAATTDNENAKSLTNPTLPERHEEDQQQYQQSASSLASKEPKKRKIHRDSSSYIFDVWFDGGSRSNPGVAGAGAVVYTKTVSASTSGSSSLVKQAYVRRFVGTKATNNVAEYHGLLAGLEEVANQAKDFVGRPQVQLNIQGDSQLVIKQILGEYSCKKETLQPLKLQAMDILAKLRQQLELHVSLEHIPRNDNKVADDLANQAMDYQSNLTTYDDTPASA